MNTTISVLGRFHLFYLAKQLQDHNCLGRLITSYPKFEAARYGLDRRNIVSLVLHEIHNRAWRQLNKFTEPVFNPQYMIFELFDRQAAGHILNQSDIFVGLSGRFWSLAILMVNHIGARFQPHALSASHLNRRICSI